MSTMPKYIVSTVIQSADIDNNEPVQVRWYTGDSLGQAISAMASAAAHHEEVDARVPAVARYSTLSVTLNIEQEGPRFADLPEGFHDTRAETRANTVGDPDRGATPSTEGEPRGFDTETVAYSLSDCAYWNTPGEECAGPRVGVVIATDDILCEKHFNHPPQ